MLLLITLSALPATESARPRHSVNFAAPRCAVRHTTLCAVHRTVRCASHCVLRSGTLLTSHPRGGGPTVKTPTMASSRLRTTPTPYSLGKWQRCTLQPRSGTPPASCPVDWQLVPCAEPLPVQFDRGRCMTCFHATEYATCIFVYFVKAGRVPSSLTLNQLIKTPQRRSCSPSCSLTQVY
jgi:hypothetical protein